MATQRSSVLLWERSTGTPLDDTVELARSSHVELAAITSWDQDQLMRTTGLPLSAHDGASKIRRLLRNSPGVSTTRQLAAGLLAAFLLHQLTQGSTFAIDVTNAARMQLVDRCQCRLDRAGRAEATAHGVINLLKQEKQIES